MAQKLTKRKSSSRRWILQHCAIRVCSYCLWCNRQISRGISALVQWHGRTSVFTKTYICKTPSALRWNACHAHAGHTLDLIRIPIWKKNEAFRGAISALTLLCDLFHSLWMRRSAAPLSSLPQISPGEPGVSLTPSWFRPNLPVPSGVCVSTVWLGKNEKMWTKLSWPKFFLHCCWSLWFLTTALELQWAGSFFYGRFS